MSDDIHVTILKDGPYVVYGGVPLSVESIGTDEQNASISWQPGRAIEATRPYALCRCGASHHKPFCDGTHKATRFDGTETASRVPFAERVVVSEGPAMVLEDAPDLCAYARFCDTYGTIWKLVERADDDDTRNIVTHQSTHCPSGRLVTRDKATGTAHEPVYSAAIVLLEDPAEECSGPIAVRGRIRIDAADGTPYELRNRVTLCRCGASKNKPFCDGTHVDVAFTDGL